MTSDKQVTPQDVLETIASRQPLCEGVVVDHPVTTDEVLVAFEVSMKRRSDIGVVNRALNVFLEPRNPFEPQKTRKPKMETVVFGMLFVVVVAAFVFFNLAAPRLEVRP
jgi:hypothetical protein